MRNKKYSESNILSSKNYVNFKARNYNDMHRNVKRAAIAKCSCNVQYALCICKICYYAWVCFSAQKLFDNS